MKKFLKEFKGEILLGAGLLILAITLTYLQEKTQSTILGVQVSVPSSQGPGQLLQSLSTGNWGLASLTAGSNITISTTTTNITISSTASGASPVYPFTTQSYGASTSTTLGLLQGFFTTASSTVRASTFNIMGLSDGCVQIASNLLTSTGSGCGTGTGATSAFEVATTSGLSISQLTYISQVSGRTTLAGVSTTTVTASLPLSLSNPVVKVGGSNSVLTIDTTGTWSGNAGTATALAGNGANCAAGFFPLGVDASGVSENCTFAVPFNFTPTSYGVSTTTTMGLLGGLTTSASSTFAGPLRLPALSAGQINVDTNGLVYSGATTTFGSGLTYTNGLVTCSGCSGTPVPNLTYLTLSGTAYYTASTTLTDNKSFYFRNGFVSNASSTISAPFRLPALTSGFAGVDSTGLVYTFATSTIKTSQLTNDSGFITSAVTSVTASPPIFSSGGATPNITWAGLATTSQPSSSNLLTSNGGAGVYGTATSTLSASSPLTGSFTQIGSGGSLGIQVSTDSQNGYLSSADHSKFNSATTTFSSPLVYTLATNAVTCSTCTVGGLISLDNFTHPATGKSATTTEIQITGGLLSTASSTFNNSVFLANLSAGQLNVGASGLLYSGASTTFSGGLTYSNGNVTCTGCGAVGNPDLIYQTYSGTPFYTASSTLTDNKSWYFGNGFVSNASSTFSNSVYLPGLTGGFAGIGSNGRIYSFATSTIKTSQLTNDAGFNTGTVTSITNGTGLVNQGTSYTTTGTITSAFASATTPTIGRLAMFGSTGSGSTSIFLTDVATSTCPTFSTGLSYSGTSANCIGGTNGNVTVNASQNITTLSNLTSNGLVYTSGGTGILNTLATSTLTGTGLISVTAGAYTLGGTPIVVSCSTCGTGTVTSITEGQGFVNRGTSITTTGTLIPGIATSATPSISGLAYWTGSGDASTPSLLGTVATGTITGSTGISLDSSVRSAIGGSLQITNTGVISGSCSGGTTCSGTNPLTISSFSYPFPAGATSSPLSFTGLVTMAQSSTTVQASFQHASTTIFTFGGVTGNKWTDFCTAITGSAALCDGDDATGGGSSFAFPFTVNTGYNSTSTSIGFTGANSLFSTGSTTFSGALHIPTILSSFLSTDSLGNVYGAATSSIKTSQLNNDAGFTTNTGTVTSLTVGTGHINNGSVITTSGTITGAIATSATPTIGNLAYWTGAGSASLSAGLGTVATSVPTVTSPLAYSGTLGSFVGGVGGAFTCTTAASGVAGCLSNTSFDTFNNKENALTFSFPLSRATNAISFVGLGTTTALTTGRVPYVSGVNSFADVATSSIASGVGITVTNGSTAYVLGAQPSIACNTASAGVFGCLSTADYSKITSATTTFSSPLVYTLATNAVTCSTCTVGGLISLDNFTHPAVGQSATTSLMLFYGNASSTGMSANFASFGATATTSITQGGFVGIGTTTPSGNLSINAPAQSNPYFLIGSTTSTVLGLFPATAVGFVDGFGSSTPAARFAIHALYQDTYNANIFMIASSSATATTTLFRIDNKGAIFVPALTVDAAAHTYTLCGEANTFELRFDTTTCVLSAAKFKTKIDDLDIGLKELMQVRPVQFYYKPTGDATYDNNLNIKHQQIGVIADEVEKIDSRLVTYDNKGEIKGFNYEQYTAWLTKAIQELAQAKGVVRRNLEENWQDLLIGLLIIGFIYQQIQIRKLKVRVKR